VVTQHLERRSYRKGSLIVNAGDEALELFIVARGQVSANVTLASGEQRRLATFTQGMAFGEMALIDKARRSAIVSADTDVECDLLPIEAYESLGETHPQIKLVVLQNLAHSLSLKLRKANREASVFDY
jgi:glutaminase